MWFEMEESPPKCLFQPIAVGLACTLGCAEAEAQSKQHAYIPAIAPMDNAVEWVCLLNTDNPCPPGQATANGVPRGPPAPTMMTSGVDVQMMFHECLHDETNMSETCGLSQCGGGRRPGSVTRRMAAMP